MFKVMVSPYKNPFINLAIEDYFLRGDVNLPVLLFYVNRPCVVMGRFQNPWLETNLLYLTQNDIWLVRRQSGGGTVYHDEGNLNWSFIVPEGMIDRKKHVELLREAFLKADIELKVSPRHDLWLEDSEGEWKKIAGSAYKQTKSASFHHGTLLINSDLKKLKLCLKETFTPKVSKSIPSVRSSVMNIHDKHPGIEIKDVIDLVTHHFKTVPFEIEGDFLSHPMIQESFTNLRGWDWLWGETPLFELGELSIRKGIIESTGEKFSAESMQGKLSPQELKDYFPDFSEQHRSSNLIWEQSDP